MTPGPGDRSQNELAQLPRKMRQIFCAQGAFGVLIEQRGAIFLGGLAIMPFGLVLWIYVFLVYGSVVQRTRSENDNRTPRRADNAGFGAGRPGRESRRSWCAGAGWL